MRLRLKYGLPALQMLLAIVLLVSTDRWERALMRVQDMPGTPPSFTLLMAINAPLAMPRAFVFRYLSWWWDGITLVVAVGLLWYWVSPHGRIVEAIQTDFLVFVSDWGFDGGRNWLLIGLWDLARPLVLHLSATFMG